MTALKNDDSQAIFNLFLIVFGTVTLKTESVCSVREVENGKSLPKRITLHTNRIFYRQVTSCGLNKNNNTDNIN